MLMCSFADEGAETDGLEHKNDMENVKKEHRLEIQTIMSDFSSAQTRLQARIVALETEYLPPPH